MKRIPFHLPDAGFRETKGLVYIDAGELIIEVTNALFGEFDRDFQVFRIAPSTLDRVELEQGLVRDHLLVFPQSDELLRKMPGEHGTHIDLIVWRRHRKAVLDLIRLLDLAGPI